MAVKKTLEKHIEKACGSIARQRGWVYWKLTVMGFPGVPDRLILAPGGCAAFVEFKAPGKKPTALQEAWHRRLRALGFKVYVIDNVEAFEAVIV
jgi:hypothetical protein